MRWGALGPTTGLPARLTCLELSASSLEGRVCLSISVFSLWHGANDIRLLGLSPSVQTREQFSTAHCTE